MIADQSAKLRELALQRPSDAWENRSLVCATIIESVALAFGLAPSELFARSRVKSVVEARMVVCYIARRCTRMSYPELGRVFNRDHTTIMSAVKSVEKRRKRDKWTNAACLVLLEQFGETTEEAAQ